MCVPQPNSNKTVTRCSTAIEGTWSEGYYEGDCSGYGRVTVLQNPDRLVLETADEFGVTHLSYTVSSAGSTPMRTPTPAHHDPQPSTPR